MMLTEQLFMTSDSIIILLCLLCLFSLYLQLDKERVVHFHVSNCNNHSTNPNKHPTPSNSSGIKILTWNDNEWKMKRAVLNKNFNNFFFDQDVKTQIKSSVTRLLNDDEFYHKFAIPRKLTYLAYGPPGGGKSSLYLTIANVYNLPVYIINSDIIADENAIDIISNIPEQSILLFEEIDTFGIQNRNQSTVDEKAMRKLRTIFDILDGYYTLPYKSIVIMTTNYLDRLDQALYRKGRVDYLIEFTKPNDRLIKEMLGYYYNQSFTELDDELIKLLSGKLPFVDYFNVVMNHMDNPEGVLKELVSKIKN
jgi:AAA+ superfamily predicted ATPase